MIIIGYDYQPVFQQIAFLDTETGECSERRLEHREEAEKFYRDLGAQGAAVRLGMEASGHARWFERLLSELRYELWIGDAAEIRTKRVRKQKTDRQDAELILPIVARRSFSADLTISAMSSTFGTHKPMHSEERHFALVEGFAFAIPAKARSQSVSGQKLSSDPCISSVTPSIMITTSNSPAKGAGYPVNYSGFNCTPWRFPGGPACEPIAHARWPGGAYISAVIGGKVVVSQMHFSGSRLWTPI
jgi:hypothetical protein